MDEATAKRIAEGLIKYGWLGKRSRVKAGWRRRLIDAIHEFAEPEPVADAEFMARAEAECGEAWVRHWNEMWRGAFDAEKGEEMAAIDDATAQRIAKHLADEGWLKDEFGSLAAPPSALSPLAKTLQDAAGPPAEAPPPNPGLYFIAESPAHVAHLEKLTLPGGKPHWRDLLWGYDVERPKPGGAIISGPHTCEELLEAVKK